MGQFQAIPIDAPTVEQGGKSWVSGPLLYTFSIFLHGVLLIAMMFVQSVNVINTQPPAIRVDLVSFSEGLSEQIPVDNTLEPNTALPKNEALQSEAVPVDQIPEVDTAMESEVEALSDGSVTASEMKVPPPSFFDAELTMPDLAPLLPDQRVVEAPVINKTPTETQPVVEKVPPNEIKKRSLKKKTFDAEKVKQFEKKRAEIKKVEQKRPEAAPTPKKNETKIDNKAALNEALARMEKRVAAQQSEKGAGVGDSTEGVVGGIAGGRASSQPIELYKLALFYRIRQNWSFNEKLAGNKKDLEVIIVLKVLKSGEIKDAWFETRSGDSYLDDSAMKAVKKSNPLPPLPPGYASYDVGLIFTPSGLQ